MELERLRKDQFSYWRGSGCVAGTPGEAYAEPGRPAWKLASDANSASSTVSSVHGCQHVVATTSSLRRNASTVSRVNCCSPFTRFHLDRMYQQIRPNNRLDVCRNVDRTTPATTVINLVTSKLNVLSASGGLKEHQPQSQVREPTYVSLWVATRALAF